MALQSCVGNEGLRFTELESATGKPRRGNCSRRLKMGPKLQCHTKRLVAPLMSCTAMFLFHTLTAGAQQASGKQTQDLEQQLQQLKQQYDETTQSLQQRIAALEQLIQNEQQIQKQKEEQAKAGTVSAVELAAQKAAQDAVQGQSGDVGAKFQGQLASEPAYDSLREAAQKIGKLQEQLGSFEFHGYFRSGYGLNGEGGQQGAFQDPGARAQFRLGNEAETYGEFIFVNNWLNPERASNDAWVKTEIMIEANTSDSTNYAAFPQAVVNSQVTSGGNDQFRL